MSEGIRIYNLFPTLAGAISDWIMHLPRIAAMGFNAVYINPFHYPGFSGSLYAVKDYYRLNPRFRGGDSGDDDTLLRRFTEAARARGLQVIMDLVVNHTSKDSELVTRHPGWFTRDSRGDVVSPCAIDPADARRTDRVGRSRRTRLPAAAAESDPRLFSRAGAPLCRSGFRRFPLRRRLQGARRGLAWSGGCGQERRPGMWSSAPKRWGRRKTLFSRSPMPASTISSTASNGGISRAHGCSSSMKPFAISLRRSAFPKAMTPSGWSPSCSPPEFRNR